MDGPATCPARSRLAHGHRRTAPSKKACTGSGTAQSFLSSRPRALILIAAPFSSRLSRYIFAEFERSMIQERVRAGLARAKSEGKRLGRPTVPAGAEKAIRGGPDHARS